MSITASFSREVSKDKDFNFDQNVNTDPNIISREAVEFKPYFQDLISETEDTNDNITKRKFIFPYLVRDATSKIPFEVDEDKLTITTLYQLKSMIRCHNRDYFKQIIPRGDYWVLKNFVKAEHGQISCYKSVTLATHATLTYLGNVKPLVERWMSPISLAIFAPDKDFIPTVNSIWYLRECLQTDLIKKYVTFHIFFHSLDTPTFGNRSMISYLTEISNFTYNCADKAPYIVNETYKSQMRLYYPVNLARNIARDAALTHFILSSDIELFPSPNMVPRFLNMIAREHGLQKLNDNSSPKVFAISIFEVMPDQPLPLSKTALEEMLMNETAVWFSRRHCPFCHLVPNGRQWVSERETQHMSVFEFAKRQGKYMHWQPVFIGTHFDPYFDERCSWEGKNDRVTQSYLLCVLDYEIMILNNAFLIHKADFKKDKNLTRSPAVVWHEYKLIREHFVHEINALYGFSKICVL